MPLDKWELDIRDVIIHNRIEGMTGYLDDMPWNEISTITLLKLANALHDKTIPEYWIYMNH